VDGRASQRRETVFDEQGGDAPVIVYAIIEHPPAQLRPLLRRQFRRAPAV